MRGAFDEEDFRPERGESDRELTLGAGLLTGLGVGLLALCGFCFVGGYAMGRRAPVVEVKQAGQAEAPIEAVSGGNAAAKPSATQSVAATPCAPLQETQPSNGQPGSLAMVSTPAVVTPAAAMPASAPVSQPIVRPALPAQNYAAQPAASAPNGVMVQVAVVSQQQDAEVLVGALRKRGYAAMVRRFLGDTMLHVQVGPFATRNDAMAVRQKLLGDGYNAVVE